MNSRALFVLFGAVAITGCASQNSATARPTATHGPSTSPTRDVATATHATSGHPTATRSGAHASPTAATTQVVAAVTGPYNKGKADLHSGNLAQAQTDFQTAINHRDHVAQAYVGLGTAAAYRHQYAVAEKAFARALAYTPHDAGILYQAAFSALYAQDYHKAVSYASSYISLRRSDSRGYRLRFQAYDQLLDPKHQLTDAGAEVRLNSKSDVAHNDLGIAYANNRKFSQAIVQFDEAIKINPRSTISYMNRGVTENLKQQPLLALADLRKARSLATDPATQKKLDGAIAYLKKALHQ